MISDSGKCSGFGYLDIRIPVEITKGNPRLCQLVHILNSKMYSVIILCVMDNELYRYIHVYT